MNASNRVVANTAVVYVSLVVKMLIGFFAVRLILQALGETDYGIYAVVAGVVVMLDVLASSMTTTSMRYLAHSLGSGDLSIIKNTFRTTVFIHFIVSIISVLIIEAGGWIMFEYMLNIPPEKVTDAWIVFHLMVCSTFININAVPYDAVMNAHEHIWVLSLFEILSAVLQLLMAVYLLYSGGNKLVEYGVILFLIQLVLRIGKWGVCRYSYEECKKQNGGIVDRDLIKSILSFTGWSLFGSLAAIGTVQLRGIIVNMFFGVRLNAAEGVSRQASGYVNMFATSMTRAINPQMMKSEGGGDRERMIRLTELGAKYSSFLFVLIGVPVMLECSTLLTIWLKDVPQYAVIFCQLMLAIMLIEKFTFQITNAIKAVGDIRNFQVTETLISLLYIPITFVLYKNGFSPEWIYYSTIFTCIVIAGVRLYFGKKVVGINVGEYFKNAILTIVMPLCIALVPAVAILIFMLSSLFRVLITSFIFCSCFVVLFWIIGINKEERARWTSIAKTFVGKIKKSKNN